MACVPSLPHSTPPLASTRFSELTLPSCLQLTVLGMRNSEEKIALQAIEFWSTVCDEEVELNLEAAEVRRPDFQAFSAL